MYIVGKGRCPDCQGEGHSGCVYRESGHWLCVICGKVSVRTSPRLEVARMSLANLGSSVKFELFTAGSCSKYRVVRWFWRLRGW